jgi:hypothetical protein
VCIRSAKQTPYFVRVRALGCVAWVLRWLLSDIHQLSAVSRSSKSGRSSRQLYGYKIKSFNQVIHILQVNKLLFESKVICYLVLLADTLSTQGNSLDFLLPSDSASSSLHSLRSLAVWDGDWEKGLGLSPLPSSSSPAVPPPNLLPRPSSYAGYHFKVTDNLMQRLGYFSRWPPNRPIVNPAFL